MHNKSNITTTKPTRGANGLSASFDYIRKNEIGEKIGQLAVRSLLYEVSATPKPGLVDRENNGAHKDMCYETFLDSAAALKDCFSRCAEASFISEDVELASTLRSIGLDGEASMFQATSGINTHKGLIFSLGILSEEVARGGMKDLQNRCAQVAALLLQGERKMDTHGQKVLEDTGIRGIRGEALSGFNTAFHVGLPALKASLEWGFSINSAMIYTLLSIIEVTEDSNVVHRGGMEGLVFMKARAGELLRSVGKGKEDILLSEAKIFDQDCIERNLSPGGSADLLAITMMLYFLEKTFYKGKEE